MSFPNKTKTFIRRNILYNETKDFKITISKRHIIVKDVGYDDLEIQDGRTASHMYLTCLKGMIGKDQKESIFVSVHNTSLINRP